MTASEGESGPMGRAALTAVQFDVSDGLGVIRLNRPETRNAMDDTLAEELYEVAQRCAARRDLRSLLIAATGPAFTVGGDISVFARADAAALPGPMRRCASLAAWMPRSSPPSTVSSREAGWDCSTSRTS
jgi:enoyl-CoA hydratase/carnithine racemase